MYCNVLPLPLANFLSSILLLSPAVSYDDDDDDDDDDDAYDVRFFMMAARVSFNILAQVSQSRPSSTLNMALVQPR